LHHASTEAAAAICAEMNMKWIDENQPVFDLTATTSHSSPGPFRMVLDSYPEDAATFDALPVLQKIRFFAIADFIAESFRPGCLPILGVKFVGHADQDAQRGHAFEQAVSETRARDIEHGLKARVDRLTWEFNPTTSPLTRRRVVDTIEWTSSGVGATRPALGNGCGGRTPAPMTEADRRLNRRVEIILEPGEMRIQTPGASELNKTIEDILRRRGDVGPAPPPSPGMPKIPWVLPERKERTTFLDMVKAINESLGFLDMDTILGSIKDNISPDDQPENWTDDFMKEWTNLENERRARQDAPPRRGVDPPGGDQ